MTEHVLVGLSAIIIFGIFAQWISWRFKLPSILLLLVLGFIAGPITGLLNPDEFFGDLLFPFVSISVAIILFEGGLSLKFDELKSVFGVVRNLITIGTVVTWTLSSFAAHYFMNLPVNLSILLGAILVVTGPTVIMPLLRMVKPKGDINAILKWEGIVNDPIGAMLALLVFETIISAGVQEATFTAIFVIFKTIAISCVIGVLGAYALVYLLKRHYIPDSLQNPATLALIILVYIAASLVQNESGLFSVTIMGIFLANQKQVVIEHIVEFKENLIVVLLSSLFIVLAARLKISDIELLNMQSLIFIAVLILVIRPVTIFLSTIGSHLNWKEKIYLSWMAPRGIVAAAVTSVFAIELAEHGVPGANLLVPIIFLVIIFTILVYGLSAIPLARILKLADLNPQGIIIAGINNFTKELYKTFNNLQIRVLLVDNNWEKTTSARQEGFETCYGNIISEKINSDIDFTGLGKFLAVTPNNGLNSLSAIHFSKIFESSSVYQINVNANEKDKMSSEFKRNIFSSKKLTYDDLENHSVSLSVKSTKITSSFSYDNFMETNGKRNYHPLFVFTDDNKLKAITENNQIIPKDGETLISLFLDSETKIEEQK